MVDFDLDLTGDDARTLAEPVSGEGKCIRRGQGTSRYGHICVTLAPHRGGPKCYRFEWQVLAGALPLPFMQSASLDGVKMALAETILAGAPVVLVSVSVVDGSYHDTDTTELDVSIAASLAVKDALRRGHFVKA